MVSPFRAGEADRFGELRNLSAQEYVALAASFLASRQEFSVGSKTVSILNQEESMKVLKIAGVLWALGFLAGCASDIQQMGTVQATGGSAFTRALTEEYRTFVAHEVDPDYDWTGANYYADKGLAAAGGEVVLPDEVTDVTVHADALVEARGRLMAALNGGARESNPEIAAEAQVAFDCWLHEAQEVDSWLAAGALPESHLAGCRDRFEAAMAALAPKAAEVVMPIEQPQIYLVLFDFDRSNLREDARLVIDRLLADIAAKGIDSVNISSTGHADRSGSVEYNEALAMRRSDAVRDALIAGGVPADNITVASRGESENAVPTADGVREQANRRVEIIMQ
jgi:OmpA-OmpF porin, OOP family